MCQYECAIGYCRLCACEGTLIVLQFSIEIRLSFRILYGQTISRYQEKEILLPPANEVVGRWCFQSCVSVSLSVHSGDGVLMWALPMIPCIGPHCTAPLDIRHGTPLIPALSPCKWHSPPARRGSYPVTDIWWTSLETCSNLFTWAHPFPQYWHIWWSLKHVLLEGGSTHPTRMLSCLNLFSVDFCIN